MRRNEAPTALVTHVIVTASRSRLSMQIQDLTGPRADSPHLCSVSLNQTDHAAPGTCYNRGQKRALSVPTQAGQHGAEQRLPLCLSSSALPSIGLIWRASHGSSADACFTLRKRSRKKPGPRPGRVCAAGFPAFQAHSKERATLLLAEPSSALPTASSQCFGRQSNCLCYGSGISLQCTSG
jgi:hypothetical protein